MKSKQMDEEKSLMSQVVTKKSRKIVQGSGHHQRRLHTRESDCANLNCNV